MFKFLNKIILNYAIKCSSLWSVEELGVLKRLDTTTYYASLRNGIIYEIHHLDNIFKVNVFHEGVKLSTFNVYSTSKNVSNKSLIKKSKNSDQSVYQFDRQIIQQNILAVLKQILSDTPFSRCKSKDFLTLAASMKAQFTIDDYLSFFFKRNYSTVGLVDYTLSMKHSDGVSYSSHDISIMDGLIYEKIPDNKLNARTKKNIQFIDNYSNLVAPFLAIHQRAVYLMYFDLNCVNIIHFVDDNKIEKIMINYHTEQRSVIVETVNCKNIHEYLESIMYQLVQIKANNNFLEHCEKCSVNIENYPSVSNEEMELFKMATY